MIIGITGPAGAGKDTAAAYVERQLGVTHVSGGDILREMLSSINLQPKKSAIGDFGTFLRTHYGPAAVLDRIHEKAGDSENFVYSGFRSVAEAEHIKGWGGTIIYIDAPEELRHARMAARSRAHENVESSTLKKLDAQEHASTHPMAENLNAVRDIADVVVMNDKDLQTLYQNLDVILQSHAR